MHAEAYNQLAKIQSHHWWFISRKKLIYSFIKDIVPTTSKSGLEIGCGTGGNLELLTRFGLEAHGIDISNEALRLAREICPDHKYIQGDANQLSTYFSDKKFAVIIILNVLYHDWVKDESNIIRMAQELLVPGGILVMTEPAFSFLWREHDLQVMGNRRYSLQQFRSLFSLKDFNLIRFSYFNCISFLPALFLARTYKRKINAATTNPDCSIEEIKLPPKWLNWTMEKILDVESIILRVFKKLPVGVSLITVLQKKNS